MKIENETIMKLSNKELNNLECMSIGICLIRGTAKQKIKVSTGFMKAVTISENEIHFENEFVRHELIKLTSTSIFEGKEEQDWAYRFFNKKIHTKLLFQYYKL